MKTNLTSRSSLLALLMVVLLLSSSLGTVAQQIPAEVQAKQDAKNDVNKFAWFTAGFIGCASSWTLLALIDIPDQSLRCLTTVPSFLPIVYAISDSPVPPTERLLGKSPEYVNVYIDSYRKEVNRQRVLFSVAGCGVSYVSTGMILLATGALDLQLF